MTCTHCHTEKRQRLHRSCTPNRGNCARQSASLDSGSNKARQLKLTICCLVFTTGLPKGLTSKICKKPRRC